MAWSLFSGSGRSKKQNGGRHRHRALNRVKRRRPLFEQLETRDMLTVFTVTNLMDGAVAPAGSLRAALEAANAPANPGADVIQFDSGLNGTINLDAIAGELPITESVSILGPGAANVTIDATGTTSRIFRIDAGDIAIKGLTLTNGAPAAGDGGAIDSTTLGMLAITDSVITGSTATNGGAIFAAGDLVLTNSVIGGTAVGAANTATAAGGGIYAQGSVTLKNTTVVGNTATAGAGGGIQALFSTVILQSSTIDTNTAGANGGGIDATTVVAQYSTISGNTALGANGGGIDAVTTVLRNSTLAGNTALVGNGGGVSSTNVTLQNATVANNSAGAAAAGGGVFATSMLNAQNSIIANNSALTFPDLNSPAATIVRFSLIQESGTIPSAGQFTITGPGAQNANGNFIGNAVAVMPISLTEALGTGGGVLANNGGPTQTIDIAGGIAVNKGSNALAVSPSQGDQRGLPFARISPLGGIVDMGAFEVQTATVGNNPPVLVSAIPNQSATVGVAFSLNAGAFFSDPDGDPLTFAAERVSGLALPDWLSFNTATGVFSGVPTATDVEAFQIKVTATDNKSVPPPPLPSSTFTLTVSAVPVVPPIGVELPFTETFEAPVPAGQIAPDPRIKEKSPGFATTTTSPITGTASLEATRPTVGSRPVATVDFNNPATGGTVTNIAVDVSTGGGNGTTLWNNAVVVFDYQSPTNYKFAGVLQIAKRLVIGQVVNGKVTYKALKKFNASPNTTIPLNVAINHTTRQVTLTSGATSVSHTFASLGTGTVGVGTINANARFDNLAIS